MYPERIQELGIELITAIAVIAILVLVVVVIMMMRNISEQLRSGMREFENERIARLETLIGGADTTAEGHGSVEPDESAEYTESDESVSISPFVEITDTESVHKVSAVAAEGAVEKDDTTGVVDQFETVFVQDIGKANTSFSVAPHDVAEPTNDGDILAGQTAFVEPGFLEKKEQQMQDEEFLSFLNIGIGQQHADADQQTNEWQMPSTPAPNSSDDIGKSGKKYTKEELEALIRN